MAWSFIWTNLIPLQPGCFVLRFDETAPMALENRVLNVYLFRFLLMSSKERGCTCDPSFEHTWIPITLECFVWSLVEIGPLVLGIIFSNVGNILLTNLNPRHPRMLCTNFCWKWPHNLFSLFFWLLSPIGLYFSTWDVIVQCNKTFYIVSVIFILYEPNQSIYIYVKSNTKWNVCETVKTVSIFCKMISHINDPL